MKTLLFVGACFICAGVITIVLAGGVLRVVGVLLVVWGLGTLPAALRSRREGRH
jgi:hypothetical protein